MSPVRAPMKQQKKHPDSGDVSHLEDIILIGRTIETVAAILAASNEIVEVAATARSKELTSSDAHDLVQQTEVSFQNLKKTLDCVGSMSNSHLFPNAHDFVITGGQFNIVNNSVDIEGREKIVTGD
ncbi:hypothetical protein BYT27DRAFT_7213204 [Phlegmacium glaucopus]|nr:hypothetical protein BYT27DRAFT_7213204 [Phlegmacium glaucopus]